MLRTIAIELGRFGWGHHKGPPAELRLGVMRIWSAPFSLIAKIKANEAALRAAADSLRRRHIVDDAPPETSTMGDR